MAALAFRKFLELLRGEKPMRQSLELKRIAVIAADRVTGEIALTYHGAAFGTAIGWARFDRHGEPCGRHGDVLLHAGHDVTFRFPASEWLIDTNGPITIPAPTPAAAIVVWRAIGRLVLRLSSPTEQPLRDLAVEWDGAHNLSVAEPLPINPGAFIAEEVAKIEADALDRYAEGQRIETDADAISYLQSELARVKSERDALKPLGVKLLEERERSSRFEQELADERRETERLQRSNAAAYEALAEREATAAELKELVDEQSDEIVRLRGQRDELQAVAVMSRPARTEYDEPPIQVSDARCREIIRGLIADGLMITGFGGDLDCLGGLENGGAAVERILQDDRRGRTTGEQERRERWDRFAAAALTGFLANRSLTQMTSGARNAAGWAKEQADAMLEVSP